MASTYPTTADAFTNPAGTQTLDNPTGGHSQQHSDANDAIENIETTLGTTAGTSVIQHFAAGQFAVRHTGVAATGTLVQTLVGGTYNSFTAGTPTIVGTIVLPNTVVPTAALVNNAVTTGSLLFNTASADGTITGGFANIGGVTGTLAVTVASDLFASFYVGAFNSGTTGINMNFRLQGTAGAGTFSVPNANGILIRHSTNNERKAVGVTGYVSGVAVGTYICAIQGSTSAGSLIVDPNDWQSASVLQLRK